MLDEFLKEGYKIYQEMENSNDLYYYIINYGKGLFREGAAIHCWDYFDSPFIEKQTKDMSYKERKAYCDELREESERLKEYIDNILDNAEEAMYNSGEIINRENYSSYRNKIPDETRSIFRIICRDKSKGIKTEDNNLIFIEEHRRNLNFIASETRLIKKEQQDLCIKLYFTINLEDIEKFMTEFGVLAAKKGFSSYFKTRHNLANDMVTVRLYDEKYLDDVMKVINKYKIDYKHNLFIPNYNGVGMMIDNHESYNSFIEKLLVDYYKTNQDISEESFKEFVRINKSKIRKPLRYSLNSRKEDASYLYYSTLDKVLNKEEFNYEIFKSEFRKTLNQNEEDKLTYQKKRDITYDIKKIMDKHFIEIINELAHLAINEDKEVLERAIENILNNDKVIYQKDNLEVTYGEMFKCYLGYRRVKMDYKKFMTSLVYEVKDDVLNLNNLYYSDKVTSDKNFIKITDNIIKMIEGNNRLKLKVRLYDSYYVPRIFYKSEYEYMLKKVIDKYNELDSYNDREIDNKKFSDEIKEKVYIRK
mgnify:CR=1 FL=1